MNIGRVSSLGRRESVDSDYGSDLEEDIDVDELHNHLDGLSSSSGITIGSNKYTEEQKQHGANEAKKNYQESVMAQRHNISPRLRGSPNGRGSRAANKRQESQGSNSSSKTVNHHSPLGSRSIEMQPFDSPKANMGGGEMFSDNNSSIGETEGADPDTGLMSYRPSEEPDLEGKCGKGCFGDKGLPATTVYNITWIVSGMVMALLKYVFCVVGAVIIHDSHAFMQTSLAVGIGINCSSTLITGLITGRFSKIGINISGPDIIASIFVSSWVKTLCYPDEQGNSILNETTALPTILFLMAASTMLMGLLWLAIGHFHATKLVEFMPAPVVCGFLSCIGWKVVKYATKVSVGPDAWYVTWTHPAGWAYLLAVPGAVMGIPLYLLKKYHIGNPMIILPFYMVAPIVVFYVCVMITGTTEDELRENHWLFPTSPAAHFFEVWTRLEWQHVNYAAIPHIMVDLCIMIIILVIDSLLKLASTKSGCQLDVDMVHEMKVTGWENIVGSLFMASPGYPQVKFNLLSYGILNNTRERRVAYFVALFGGVMWFAGSGFMLIHYLPRFYLGGLLWYAACPFIVQNLIETYFHMEKKEYIIVLTIFATVVVFDLMGNAAAMLIAVAVGAVMATFVFMSQYARVSVIREQFNLASTLTEGKNYQSKVVRRYFEDALLDRCAKRTAYIQLEGFIFFASATQVLSRIKEVLKKSDDIVQKEKDHKASPFKRWIGHYGRIIKVTKKKYKIILDESIGRRDKDGFVIPSNDENGNYIVGASGGSDGDGGDGGGVMYVTHMDVVQVDNRGIPVLKQDSGGVTSTVNPLGVSSVGQKKKKSNKSNTNTKNKDGTEGEVLAVGTRIQIIEHKVNEGRIGEYLRLRYVVIDFEHVQSRSADGTATVGMDYSGLRTFLEVKRLLKEASIYCIFTGVSTHLLHAFRREHICEPSVADEERAERDGQYVIHTAIDMDRGAEIVENRTLARSAKLRHHWLLFDSFKKVHVEAQLKTKHQVFDVVLGGAAGANLYEYADHAVREPGYFIVTEGEQNDNLYLLQFGKVTAYTAQTENVTKEQAEAGNWSGVIKRLRTMRGSSGAVINDDSVYNNQVISHSVVVDEKSVVWSIPKKNLKKMERDNPALAVAIHRHISKFALVCRDRLEREVINLEIMEGNSRVEAEEKNSYFRKRSQDRKKSIFNPKSSKRNNKNKKSKNKNDPSDNNNNKFQPSRVTSDKHHASNSLAQTISRNLQMAHWKWSHKGWSKQHEEMTRIREGDEKESIVTSKHAGTLAQLHDAQHHHGHHFHHLGTALEIIDHDKDEDERILQEKPWWLLVKPHVSSVMAENARKSFDMWADDYMYDQQQAQERKNSMGGGAGRVGKDDSRESPKILLTRRSISQVTDDELAREMKSFSEKNLPTKRKSKSTDDLMRITSTATGGRGSGGHRKKLSNNGSILLIDTTTPALVKVGEGPAKRGSIHGSQGGDIFAHPAPHKVAERRRQISNEVSPGTPNSTASSRHSRRSPRMSPMRSPHLGGGPAMSSMQESKTFSLDGGTTNTTTTGTTTTTTTTSSSSTTTSEKDGDPAPHSPHSPPTSNPSSPRCSMNSGFSRTSSNTSVDDDKDEEGLSGNSRKFIDVHLIQMALMDLGLYPTLVEVNAMHRILSDKHDRIHAKKADFDEFKKMVEILTLATIDDTNIIQLHNMFRQFGIDPPEDDEENIRHEEKVLDMDGLGLLMDALGHHDERLELVCIMSEWDLHDRGYLDFEAFLSVVSTYMKVEQLDQKVEEDFLKVCGLNEKQVHDLEVNLARQSFVDHHNVEEGEDEDDDGIQEISSKHLWRAIRKFGPTVWGRKKTAAISLKDVEEMVYDADVIDQSGDMKVSLSELLNALEMVATEEIKQDLGKSEQGMIRVPTGRHLAALMNMESASETLVDRARRASVKRSESATHLVANTFSRTPASKSGGHGRLRASTNM